MKEGVGGGEGGGERERNPRPRQHLCPVLSVISSLLHKAFSSASPELSLCLSHTHCSSFSNIHKANMPPIFLCMSYHKDVMC